MRGMKFDVREYTNDEFKALQKALFELGYGWGDRRTIDLQDRGYKDNFIYANTSGAIRRGETEHYFIENDNHLEVVECKFTHTVKVIIPDPKPVELVVIDGVSYNKNEVLQAIANNQVKEFLK